MRKHLRRLEHVWIDWPIYFITTCTFSRRPILTSEKIAKILTEEWRSAHDRHGWAIGRYVIMPDHVHFFCSAELAAKSLPVFMQAWKQWTSKRMAIMSCDQLRATVRSGIYVRENPIRAGLVAKIEDWPWQGEIESLIL
jgi:putative transposase